MLYVYDETGVPIGMLYHKASYAEGVFNRYLFERDVSGNVIAVYDIESETKAKVGSYCYDAWGNCTVLTNTDGIGALNPFRYRGYYLDTETNLYYLQTRYYDSYVGRFINADRQLNGGMQGDNLFSYCENNPVMQTDATGTAVYKNFSDDLGYTLAVNYASGGPLTGGGTTYPCYPSFLPTELKEDIRNFNLFNTDENVVFSANYFSAYKGRIVILTDFDASFSFGIIGLSRQQKDSETLNHEYGHTLQLAYMGVVRYTIHVALPSVTINLLERCGKLTYDYYGAPWEAEADKLGGVVNRTTDNAPWPDGYYYIYYYSKFITQFWY